MGLMDFVKKQFIDILQWTEDGDDVLAWRFPTADKEIQQGTQLIVRETQAAVIYRYRISVPRTFFQRVSGTRESYLVGDLEGQLRDTLVTTLADHFAESRVPFLDMAANQVELAAAV
jgi:membrane protease subunit (stomatin/prohibitin family)